MLTFSFPIRALTISVGRSDANLQQNLTNVNTISLLCIIATLSGAPVALAGEHVFNSGAQHVALLELYTSEGCSSPRDTLAGYVVAARPLDECRALLTGNAGEYRFVS